LVFSAWVAEQMALPPSLHRAHFRRRANPRVSDAANASAHRACEPGSRWHRYALTLRDVGVRRRPTRARSPA
jgi:hypothetical protein